MAASNHCLAFVAEERWRHLAAFSFPGRRVDASEAALAWRWLAGGPLVGPDSMGDVGGPAFAARSAAVPSRSTTGRPVASQRPRRSDAWNLHRRRELGVVRRRRRRLVVNLHLAGRGGAAAGAGVVASADVEDDGPVSVA